MSDFPKTGRNQVRRKPQRGDYQQETIYQIIDEAPICHVGFVVDGQPYVIPTLHARRGDDLFLHGAPASRLLKVIEAGAEVCITMTLVDGIVLARSAFHHSINYRSAVLFGRGAIVTEPGQKIAALAAITEHIAPGRWQEVRQPSQQELDATTVVTVPIASASAKIRSGPPLDDEADYALPIWAGVLPLALVSGAPEPDPRLQTGIPLPPSLRDPTHPRR
jgi:nitroimidazol reductase NimA-like FMN-containing flavoprotein (pyridoxamine 5'-phosphate oxidase superfamily)